MQGGISIKYKDIEHEIAGNSAFKLDTKGAYMEDDITISTDIEPELGEKTITENGTYYAFEDNLDGYDEVSVNIPKIVESKNITQNGIYEAPEGVDGYSPITVNVPNTYDQSEIGKVVTDTTTLTSQTSTTIRSNNTYDTTLNNEVVVEVPNTYTVEDEGKVVNNSELVTQSSTTKNANGTYNTTLNNEVVINVPNTYTQSDEGKVVDNGALVTQTSTTKTANGTYNTTTNDEVVINVPNSYSASDEGRVVNNGALVAQTSTHISTNGIWDTTLNNEIEVNVHERTMVAVNHEFLNDFIPVGSSSGATYRSVGFKFYCDRGVRISKIRIYPAGNLVSSLHLIRVADNKELALIENVPVVSQEWNAVPLNGTFELEANEQYFVWFSEGGVEMLHRYYPNGPSTFPTLLKFVHIVRTYGSSVADTEPTGGNYYDLNGIDLIIDEVDGLEAEVAFGGLQGALKAGSTTSILSYAFYGNAGLLSTEGLEVSDIGSSAFYGCTNLSHISFPNCSKINQYAFYNCSDLSQAYFPACTSINGVAFQGCRSLIETSFPVCTYLGTDVFESCSSLREVDFPLVSSIGSDAFRGCSALTTAIFPECIELYLNVFFACHNLSYVSFPKCRTIRANAFDYCSSLTEISFPECTLVSTSAFRGNLNLREAFFPKCSSFGAYAFYNCSSLETISIPECGTIGEHAFQNTALQGEVSLPKVVTISASAFLEGDFNYVHSPELVTVGANVFYQCYNLSELYAPKLSTIGNSAFQYCSSMTAANYPRAMFVGSYVFGGCTNLSVAYLSTSTLYTSAFYNCTSLESLYLMRNAVTTLGNVNVFNSTPMSLSSYLGRFGSIYVPDVMYSYYMEATGWSAYASRIVSFSTSMTSWPIIPIQILNESCAEVTVTENSLTLSYFSTPDGLSADGTRTGGLFYTFGKSASLSIDRVQQVGRAYTTAKLPEIISTGAGRIAYQSASAVTYSPSAGQALFAGNSLSVITLTLK